MKKLVRKYTIHIQCTYLVSKKERHIENEVWLVNKIQKIYFSSKIKQKMRQEY